MFEMIVNKLYQEKIALFLFILFIISLVYQDGLEILLLAIFHNCDIEFFKNFGFVEAFWIVNIPQFLLLLYMFFRSLFVKSDSAEIVKNAVMKYWIGILFFIGTIVISVAFSTNVFLSAIDFYIYILWRLLPLVFVSVMLMKLKQSYMDCLLFLIYSFTITGTYVFYQGLFQGVHRPAAWHYNALYFAGIAIMIEVVCFCCILFKVWQDKNSCFLYIPLVIIWGSILYNSSRGAWIAIICSFLLIFFLVNKKYKRNFVKIAGILAIETVLVFSVNTSMGLRFQSIVEDSAKPQNPRYVIWKSSIDMFLDYPITGVGFGRYYHFYETKYGAFKDKDNIRHAHNDYLHILADDGIIGLCGFITMFAVICWKHLKRLQHKFNPYSVTCLSVLIAFLVHGLTEYNFGANAAVVMIMWLVVSILTVLAELEDCYIDELQ